MDEDRTQGAVGPPTDETYGGEAEVAGEGEWQGPFAGASGGQVPGTAAVLARWRQRAGLSRQRLADMADVSATYVRTIEAGVDDQGRQVVPSPAIMQKLAHALAQAIDGAGLRQARAAPGTLQASGSPQVAEPLEQRIYAEFLAAAGVLPSAVGPRAPHGPGSQVPCAPPQAPVALAERAAPYAAEGVTVLLRDPRLWADVLPLLEGWGSLEVDEQQLILSLMAYIHRRHTGATRSQGGTPCSTR